jgi:hypothetical protein
VTALELHESETLFVYPMGVFYLLCVLVLVANAKSPESREPVTGRIW